MDLNNKVTKVLNVEHGRKVIQWFKYQGVDTKNYVGTNAESIGDTFIYYGLSEGVFDCRSWRDIQDEKFEIVELPEDIESLPIPRMVMVRDEYDAYWSERKLISDLTSYGFEHPYICLADGVSSEWEVWEEMKEIDTCPKMTIKDAEIKFSIKIIEG